MTLQYPQAFTEAENTLLERDEHPRVSGEWEWRNRAAWRLFQLSIGGCWLNADAIPDDFGPHYLEPQYGVAAE